MKWPIETAADRVLASLETDGWTLHTDCGPCAYFEHEDGGTTETVYPADVHSSWPRYVDTELFEAARVAVATLAHSRKPAGRTGRPGAALPGWSGIVNNPGGPQ